MSDLLGWDASGNGNDWTVNNLSITDQMLDSPTNNFATLNPLANKIDLSEGNLFSTETGSSWLGTFGTFGMTSGKWYWEVEIANAATTSGIIIGIADSRYDMSGYVGYEAGSWGYYIATGKKVTGGTFTTYGDTYTTGDIIGIAYDADAGDLFFYKNNAIQNSGTAAFTGLTGTILPVISVRSSSDAVLNFGQDSTFAGEYTNANDYSNYEGASDSGSIGDFFYEPPTGFLALCTKNLPDVADGLWADGNNQAFNTVTYAGTGAAQNIDVGFQSDLTWLKIRNPNGGTHILTDSVRGVNKQLFSNLNILEATATNKLTDFISTPVKGFTLGADDGSGTGDANYSGNYVSWNWKAGTSASGSTGNNKAYSASYNQDAGFSIVTYVGDQAQGHEIPHHLTKAPEMIIVKKTSDTDDWKIYTETLGATTALKFTTATDTVSTSYWQDTAPDATNFTVGYGGNTNATGDDHIAYCFHSVEGYSKVGSYTGNGSSDGTFVHTGFKPAYVMVKRTDSAGYWALSDSERSPFNVMDDALYANASNSESTPAQAIDYLSNGFKFRSTDSDSNSNSGTHIYIAFAEHPFKYSTAR